MAARQRIDIARVAATDHAADGDAAFAEVADHHPIALPKAIIRQRQPAETVVLMRIDAGIVEDEVGNPTRAKASRFSASSVR